MFRPDGWDAEEIAHAALRNNEPYLVDEYTACCEAGADAMLEELKKNTLYSNDDEKTFCAQHIKSVDMLNATNYRKGRLVFIPDDQEKFQGNDKIR